MQFSAYFFDSCISLHCSSVCISWGANRHSTWCSRPYPLSLCVSCCLASWRRSAPK